MKKLLILVLSLFFITNYSYAGTFKADARTRRIPAGTEFKIEISQPVNTFSAGEGDYFTAFLKDEISMGNSVILPKGSVLRGSVSNVKTAKRLSRGAKLYLDFDHVVTPNGRQIPLDLAICKFENIYYDGGLYKNLGYGEAIQNNYERAKDITKNATEYGLSVQDSHPGLQYLTTPFCAVGGFIGGIGYWVGDSVADMFRKGQEVQLNKGDILNVKLVNPIDIPVY